MCRNPAHPDLLQEHESTMHWALMMNMDGRQGELEHSKRMRLFSLVVDRHPPSVPLRPNIEMAA